MLFCSADHFRTLTDLFRPMRITDVSRVVDLLRQVGNSYFEPPEEKWFLEQLSLPTFHIFVMEDYVGKVVAMTFLNCLLNPKYGWRGYIDYVVVEELYRRHGWGREIMKGTLHEAKKFGCREVLLSTSSPEAQALYESLGFETKTNSVLMRLAS